MVSMCYMHIYIHTLEYINRQTIQFGGVRGVRRLCVYIVYIYIKMYVYTYVCICTHMYVYVHMRMYIVYTYIATLHIIYCITYYR